MENNSCSHCETSSEKELFTENKIDIFKYLDETQEELEQRVQGLSELQIQYKLYSFLLVSKVV